MNIVTQIELSKVVNLENIWEISDFFNFQSEIR